MPERFIDTSMLVRYFTDDIPDQAAIAEAIIEVQPLLVNSVILMECGYVLTRLYQYPKVDVIDVLIEFLRRSNVQMVDLPNERAMAALTRCRESGRLSFGDALIVAAMQERGVAEIYAFDQRFMGGGIHVLTSA